MPAPDEDTVHALDYYRGWATSLEELAVNLGLPPSYKASISAIMRGVGVSMQRENEIRRAMGLPARNIKTIVTMTEEDLRRMIRNRRPYEPDNDAKPAGGP